MRICWICYLYELIVWNANWHAFVWGIIKRIVLPKENIYFSKTDESLWLKAIGPVKWQPVAYEIAKGYYG